MRMWVSSMGQLEQQLSPQTGLYSYVYTTRPRSARNRQQYSSYLLQHTIPELVDSTAKLCQLQTSTAHLKAKIFIVND